MIKVEKKSLGQLATNSYFLWDDDVIIIDPADDCDYISNLIFKNELKLTKILFTHGHFDHILASAELKLIYKCKIYSSFADNFLISSIKKTAEYYTKNNLVLVPVIDFDLAKIQTIKVKNYDIEIIKTPGHTPGSISFYIKKINALFTGDLIFENCEIGSLKHKYSNKEDMINSLKKILTFNDKTMIYPGHGNSFLLKNIRKNLSLLIENDLLNDINNSNV